MIRLSSHRMRRWVIYLAAVVLLGALLFWVAQSIPRKRVTLPDGREFSVLGVTHGTQHQFNFGPGWLRPFSRSLPARVRARLGVTTVGLSTTTPALVVWGAWLHDAPTNQAARLGSVADADGREAEPRRQLKGCERTASQVVYRGGPNKEAACSARWATIWPWAARWAPKWRPACWACATSPWTRRTGRRWPTSTACWPNTSTWCNGAC